MATARTSAIIGFVLMVCSASPAQQTASQATDAVSPSYLHALNLGYNLDYPEALAAFREAASRDPDNPALYRLAAATAWTWLLFAQGAVTVEDYLGEAQGERPKLAFARQPVDLFRTNLDEALRLSTAQLQQQPSDPDAHYQVGAAYSLLASYTATVEGRTTGSLGPARRAYREHERVLALDPRRNDAGFTVGLYRYAVASLPRPLRLMARIVGFGSGRDAGLALVEEAARHPSDVQPNALFVLVLLYNREHRYDAALRTIEDLQRRFPRNRLLWLEEAATALRAENPARSRAAAERGLEMLATDPRPRASGEESRWRHVYGASLLRSGLLAPSEEMLRAALTSATRDWVRGRIHVELGRLADLRGQRQTALNAYRRAESLCRADRDRACVSDTATLESRPYRQ